jgi:hypothetical protein
MVPGSSIYTQYDQMICHNNIALVGREHGAGNDGFGDEDDDNGWICTAPAHQELENASARR